VKGRGTRLVVVGLLSGALFLAILLFLTSRDGGTQELAGEGFSVEVPEEWIAPDVSFPLADEAQVDLGDLLLGIDEENWIVAYSFEREGDTAVSEGNVMAFAPALGERFETLSSDLPGAELTEEPYPVEVAGIPSLRLRLTYKGQVAESNELLLTQLFGQELGYVVGCNYSPAQADEVVEACDAALATFEEDT